MMTSLYTPCFFRKQTMVAAALLVLVSGCEQMPTVGGGGNSTAGSAVVSCLTGVVLSTATKLLIDNLSGKKTGNAAALGRTANVAAAGCVIGVAATAIGKMLNSNQQQRYEEAMQRDAQRRNKEQADYATARRTVEMRPATNARQAQIKDEELARLQREYEASMARPVSTDLGNGATVVTQGSPPITTGDFAGCQRKTNLVNTPAGQARQEELFCPNDTGTMVRVEAKAV